MYMLVTTLAYHKYQNNRTKLLKKTSTNPLAARVEYARMPASYLVSERKMDNTEHLQRIEATFVLSMSGMSHSDIATELGVTVRAVENYLTLGTALELPSAGEYNQEKYSDAYRMKFLAMQRLLDSGFSNGVAMNSIKLAQEHMDKAMGVDNLTMAQKELLNKVEAQSRFDTQCEILLDPKVSSDG